MPRPSRLRPPRAAVLAAAVVSVLLGAGVGLAAALGVVSKPVTVHTAAASISPTTCTLNAANNDSYADQLNPGSNLGSSTTLDVRSFSGSRNKRTFVQFSLASCSIPANSLITGASLSLFMYTAPTATRNYEARRVSASWTEGVITWTNQPAVASPTSTIATGTTSNVTLTWPVTADVQAFVDGTANNGWRIGDQTESSTTSRQGQFRSAEHGTASQRPVLAITYYP